MNKEFIPYEEALALKELGFDEPCFGFYDDMDNNTPKGGNYPCDGSNSAPLYQQAFRWFRNKGFNFSIDSQTMDGFGNHKDYHFKIDYRGEYLYRLDHRDGLDTYEEAELALLKKLIEIVSE